MTVPPISGAGASLSALSAPTAGAASTGGAPFSNLFDRFLNGAAESNSQVQAAVTDLALGRTDNLHEVMLQVAQGDLTFRLILEIRNRLTEAYQEITKMQI